MRFCDLADLLRRELGRDQAERVCTLICREASGEKIYVPQRTDRPQVLPTDTPKTVQRRHGVSRSTAYNWVSSWRK